MSLSSFFDPKVIAVVGVSGDPNKLGSVVFNNIIDAKYKGDLYAVSPKHAGQKLYGKSTVSKVTDIDKKIDLVVIVIPAKFVSEVVDDCIASKVKNISIISAGFAEVGNHELENEIYRKCMKAEINVLGPNCLGHISTFTNLNATFADGNPEKGNIAIISQSGAYCSAILDWAIEKGIGFSHLISIGNKMHLSEVELIYALKEDKNTKAFVLYLESLKNGKEFLQTLQEVTKTKPVVILESGKSKKAQAASLSHTGSLAPNFKVLEMAFKKFGAIQVYSAREMFGLLEILQYSKNQDFSGSLGILTNAGGVGVVATDLCDEYGLNASEPSDTTKKKLEKVLPPEVALGNPIDLIGDAKDDRYEIALDILCKSEEYKNILVLLTPQRVTNVEEIANVIVKLNTKYKNINIFASFVGGKKCRPGVEILKQNHIVHFDYPVDGISLLGKLKKQSERKIPQEIKIISTNIPAKIKDKIAKYKTEGFASLPQNIVTKIMNHYNIDYPKSRNFTDKNKCLAYCKRFFPSKVVLKLSAPEALHKTEMKGVYLNIDNTKKFNKAWDKIYSSIKKFNLKDASILVQEMVLGKHEIIVGVNSDDNFGRVMVFGAGGVYTEIIQDTTLRVLPTNDFKEMIAETKIGIILNGVRGEKPMAINQLLKTLEKIQKLVLELPEITAIDANPILITENRAVVVDFKMLLK